mmetsp:Transcript_14952/g.35928  ORF Transcript_14952/g.35928 Transcript_14952/m.35928 type:complete len:248 (-) Transcript_14952:232-975(-)
MSNTAPVPVAAEETAIPEQKGDFFNMFHLALSRSYEEDVHLATSSYTPFQGAASAASAVVGGILSVIDTALAVMNEEFDNPSDSIISDSTKEDDEDDEDAVMRCCRKTKRSLTSTSGDTERPSSATEVKPSDNSEQSENYESETNYSKERIEQKSSQEKCYFTPENSLVGSISMLQLYEDSHTETMTPLISGPHSKMIHDEKMNKISESLCKDFMSESEISKKEDSEYCIIKDDRETFDGWLVVRED